MLFRIAMILALLAIALPGVAAAESTEPSEPPEASDAPAAQSGGIQWDNVDPDAARRYSDRTHMKNLVILGPQFVFIFPAGVFGRYHRLVTDNVSVQGGFGYARLRPEDVRLTGVRVLAGADYHPSANGMQGLYVGPRLNLRSFTLDIDGGTARGQLRLLNAVGVVGYRAITPVGFSAGFGLGAGYGAALTSVSAEDAEGREADTGVSFSGFRFVVELTLGWAF